MTTGIEKTVPAKCKVAFIGAGYMGAEHAKAFRDIPGVELTAVFSRTTERAKHFAKENGVKVVCHSIDEVYERSQANLVIISVPELQVRATSEKCFAFPWTCLIEKPAGYTVPDAEAIATAAKVQGRAAYVALNRRHYSSTRAIVEDMNSVQDARFIHVQDQEDPAAALLSGQPQEVVNNWMFANSIHLVDYFSVLARGQITKVEPIVRWNPSSPGIVIAKISYDSGDIGLYEAVWNAPGPWAISVTTHRKRWELRPLERAAFQIYGSRKLEPMDIDNWDQQFKPGLRRQAELAVRATRGEHVPELPTVHDALGSMHLTQAIYDVG